VLTAVVRVVEKAVPLLALALLDDGAGAGGLDGLEQVLRGLGGDRRRLEHAVDVLRERHRGLVGLLEGVVGGGDEALAVAVGIAWGVITLPVVAAVDRPLRAVVPGHHCSISVFATSAPANSSTSRAPASE